MGKKANKEKITLDNSPVEEEIINVENPIKDEVVPEETTETGEEKNAQNNEEIVQNVIEEEIKVIGFDNNPINLEAKGDFRAPRGFVPIECQNEVGKYGCLDGRTYQVIAKDVAVWCDNGKQFSISKYAEKMRG